MATWFIMTMVPISNLNYDKVVFTAERVHIFQVFSEVFFFKGSMFPGEHYEAIHGNIVMVR